MGEDNGWFHWAGNEISDRGRQKTKLDCAVGGGDGGSGLWGGVYESSWRYHTLGWTRGNGLLHVALLEKRWKVAIKTETLVQTRLGNVTFKLSTQPIWIFLYNCRQVVYLIQYEYISKGASNVRVSWRTRKHLPVPWIAYWCWWAQSRLGYALLFFSLF